MGRHEVVDVEREFWDRSNDPEFFTKALTDDAITVFEPMGFVTKEQGVEEAKQSPGWTDVNMQDVEVREITPDVVAVVYHASAKKKGTDEPYLGSIASVYVKRDGRWQLALTSHQPWKREPT